MDSSFSAVESLKAIESNYGPEVAREVVQIFMKDYSAKIQKLRQSIEHGELEKIRFSAHDIKSGCLSMGVKPMSELCEKIEHDGAKMSKDELKEMTDSLESRYNQISQEYGQYYNLAH